jgi:hypothetical protein
VRIWIVALGDGDVEGLGDGDADVPARRDSPPPKITPMRRSVRRPPATAARMRSIHRGPRRGGGMIFVVSDMPINCRTPRAAPAKQASYAQTVTRVLIALALVLASCASPSAAPSATPTPAASATAFTASPTVASSPTVAVTSSPVAADPSRYGYVLPSNGRVVVRPERSTDAVIATGGEQPAASPDGKRIAFWRTGPQGNNPQELRVMDVPGGAEQRLMSIAAGLVGGPIVWSSDGTGLLYAVQSAELFPGIGGGPRSSTLESFDLSAPQAPGATNSELRLTSGAVFVPLSWDKAGSLVTALVTGEGGMGRNYVTWDRRAQSAGQSPVKFTPFPWAVVAFTVQASPDAKRLLAIDGAANVLRIWPAADIAAADMVGPGTATISDARWRPGTPADVAWVIDQNVGIFTYQTGSSGIIHRGQSEIRIMAWRVDGSGLAFNERARGVLVVEVSSGQVTALSGFGGVIAGAVLLR